MKELTDIQKNFVKLYSEAITTGGIAIDERTKIATYISGKRGTSLNMAMKNLNNKYLIPYLDEINAKYKILKELESGKPIEEEAPKVEKVEISEKLRTIGVLSLNDVILPTLEKMRQIADEAQDVNMLEKVLKMILEVKKNFDDKEKDYAMLMKSATMEGLLEQLDEVIGKMAGVDALNKIARKVLLHESPDIVGYREHE